MVGIMLVVVPLVLNVLITVALVTDYKVLLVVPFVGLP